MPSRKLTDFRKKYLKFRTSEARRKIKIESIKYKGGQCTECGYNKCPSAMVFHHLDPSQKDFGISESGRLHKNFEAIKPELDKCILLCSNCHSELHFKEDQKNRQLKLEEIEKEKRDFNPSINKICACCFEEIKIFASTDTTNNFCSVRCKKAFTFNNGWPIHSEFIILCENFPVKEIALRLNKPLSSVYERINQMTQITTEMIKPILKFFADCKEDNLIHDYKSYPKLNGYAEQEQIFFFLKDKKWIKETSLGWEMTDSGYKYYLSLWKNEGSFFTFTYNK